MVPRRGLHDSSLLCLHTNNVNQTRRICRHDRQRIPRHRHLPSSELPRQFQRHLHDLLDHAQFPAPSGQLRFPLANAVGHLCGLPAKLYGVHGHGHHPLHTAALADLRRRGIHTHSLVGLLVGMVLHLWPPRRRCRDEHGLATRRSRLVSDHIQDPHPRMDHRRPPHVRRLHHAIRLDSRSP